MDRKIFSFDLQRFDNSWSKVEDEDAKWIYGENGSTIATVTGAYSTLTLTTSGSIGKVSLTSTESLLGSYTALDANAAALPLYFDLATNSNIKTVVGGSKNDTLIAGTAGVYLSGGDGTDSLVGGSGNDYFIYSAGKDVIVNYTYGKDVVSLTGNDNLPTTFDSVSYKDSNLAISLTSDNVLTFKNTQTVSIASGDDNYYYGSNIIIVNNQRVTLAPNFSEDFSANKAKSAYENITSIDGSAVTTAGGIRITANTSKASSIIGASSGGYIFGSYKNDYIKSSATNSTVTTTLNGSDGNDTLVGNTGVDIFIYTGGKDSISGYSQGDSINVSGSEIALSSATFKSAENDLVLDFGNNHSLSIAGGATTTVTTRSGNSTYVYKNNTVTLNESRVTLTSSYSDSTYGGSSLPSSISAINASAVSIPENGISIVGNNNGNYIIGSATKSNSLLGGTGNDTLTGGNQADLFYYNGGKDIINGFVSGTGSNSDRASIAPDKLNNIASAKLSRDSTSLAFTSSKNDVLTFKSDSSIEKISVENGGFLTKDGYVDTNAEFKLFANAKGNIDLTDDPYKGTDIATINAANSKNLVTLTAVSLSSPVYYTLANNKKKDVFNYNGGNVSISGWESGYDKLNIVGGFINSFSIGGDDLYISVSGSGKYTGGTSDVISISGGKDNEMLIHQSTDKGSSYAKMVFNESGVLLNKLRKPTAATITSAIDKDKGFTANTDEKNTISKITIEESVAGTSIYAGNRTKTIFDASLANGVTLIGGAKNDKFTGRSSVADTFVYAGENNIAGKDVITNYESGSDEISFATDIPVSLNTAKISAKNSGATFKFNQKNSLNVKAAKNSTISAITFDGTDYKFGKNWFATTATPTTVSLTSQFSGTFKTDDKALSSNATVVAGNLVQKNLTYKGTSAAESLVGGSNSKMKTTFKGGGGNDTLVGGASKDIFSYSKNNSGNVEIQKFDLTNDKLKIAGGTISTISTVSGGIRFNMNNASFNIGDFVTYDASGTESEFTPTKFLIHANNTYYWFAEETITDTAINSKGETETTLTAAAGSLVTTTNKISKSTASNAEGYSIIELGYSTNLASAGVAKKFSSYTFTSSGAQKKS